MATASLSGDSRYYLDFDWALVSQDIPTNRSLIYQRNIVNKGVAGGSWTTNAASWGHTSGPSGLISDSGYRAYDFRVAQTIQFNDGYHWFDHNADGTLTLTLTGSVSLESLGGASIPLTATLPRIPRGPRVRHGGTWKPTVAYVRSGGTWRVAIPYVRSGGTWGVAS